MPQWHGDVSRKGNGRIDRTNGKDCNQISVLLTVSNYSAPLIMLCATSCVSYGLLVLWRRILAAAQTEK